MNERIKAVRKALGLTMEQFGEKIGMGKSSVSKIEKGLNSTTEQTIKSICREFGVNEAWLRTGSGEMFDQSEDSVLNRLAEEYHLDDRKKAVVVAFLKLSTADQEAILRYVDTLSAELAASPLRWMWMPRWKPTVRSCFSKRERRTLRQLSLAPTPSADLTNKRAPVHTARGLFCVAYATKQIFIFIFGDFATGQGPFCPLCWTQIPTR